MAISQQHRIMLAAVIGCMALLNACGSNPSETGRTGSGTVDMKQQSLHDRDSRNNEDNSLGVKTKWVKEQNQPQGREYGGRTQLDMTNPHLSKTMAFTPQIANRVQQMPGIQSAQVLLTEMNAYVAVVLNGHNPDAEASPEVSQSRITSNGGAGLFGTDQSPNRISWTESGGLSYRTADEISKQVLGMVPTNIQQVYVSANPNFVQRVKVYAEEEQKGALGSYLNEFNTMVQHVFQRDTNTRK
ncbi:hypothetical protein FPZ49_10280 [Paenibacillus cremeus]|uniref:YhcN/YlaJ family sporulation lipoprotein n=1 Tax=Paenibacillus cremeus TaxID=2163881 RepID=A0A559KDE4_9BACL|nr:hypothetical protein FPZ49_10280 [Paenibacillus cremeus]